MAAYDFPPTAGQPTDGSFEYTAPDGTLYEWNGYAWKVPPGEGGGGSGGGDFEVPTQALPPAGAVDGDMFWCTDDGRLYIYYEDVNTSQWVDASPDNTAEAVSSYWRRSGTTLSPENAGDSVDLGTGTLSANSADIGSGNIMLNADGSTSQVGNCTARAFLGVNTQTASSSKIFQLTSGNGEVVNMTADGSAYFGVDKARILADGKAYFQGNAQVAVNSSNVNSAAVEGVFLSVGGSQTNTVTNTGSSTVAFRVFAKGSTTNRVVMFGNGNMNLAGVLSENASDIKFKKDIQLASAQWDHVKALKLKSWTWRDIAPGGVERNSRRNVGLVAQEAEQVDPKLVYEVQLDEIEGNTYKAVDTQVLTMKLLGALQESMVRIEALEAEVQLLKGGN